MVDRMEIEMDIPQSKCIDCGRTFEQALEEAELCFDCAVKEQNEMYK